MALCFALPATAAADPGDPLRLGTAEGYDAVPHLRVFPADPTSDLADFDAGRLERSETMATSKEHLREDGDLWMVLQVERSERATEDEWVLWIRSAAQWLDARVTAEGQEPEVFRNGFFASPAERPLQAVGYAFPIHLDPGQRAEVVLRGYLPPRDSHRVMVLPAPRFRHLNLLSLLLVFGVMGAALALGSYNFVMFVVAREAAYGYYALYALSSVFLWASTHSVLTLFTGDGETALTINGLSVLLTAFAALRFTHEFLELRTEAPRLHRAFQALSLMFVGLTVALFVLPQPQFKQLASAVGIPTMAIVVLAPVWALTRGYRRARFMVVGWAPLMVFPFLLGLRSLGIIRANWLSSELMLAVHGFEILTMAIALGDRWREIVGDREKARDHAMRQLELRLKQSEELAKAQHEEKAARAAAEMERMRAHLDALTGLRNRRAFDSEFPRMKGATGAEGDAALYVIDLDGLKAINDDLGHAAGDRLLAQFAHHLSRCLRGNDRVYRIGGDEFAVLAHVGGPKAVSVVAERIREAAEALREEFPAAGASIGVAQLSEVESDLEAAYRLADERMYQEKRAHHEASEPGA